MSKIIFLLFTISYFLTGVLPASYAADLTISPRIYYGKNNPEGLDIELPVKAHTIYSLKLFEQIISYRNDKKAHIDFTLPPSVINQSNNIEMILEAYNDDHQYLRAIWFEIDSVGGYLGVTKVADGQYRGNISLPPKQKNRWKIDLSQVYVSTNNSEKRVNFTELLKRPGIHTLSCWISTYGKFGPQSWVSVELKFD